MAKVSNAAVVKSTPKSDIKEHIDTDVMLSPVK
jgi:hypothetical protein